MAKKIDGYIKLNIPAGAANPSPPVGPALGQRGINIEEEEIPQKNCTFEIRSNPKRESALQKRCSETRG